MTTENNPPGTSADTVIGDEREEQSATLRLQPDRSETALESADVAAVLERFHRDGKCTIGAAACLVLGAKADSETGWPANDEMEYAHTRLCERIRHVLFEAGAHRRDPERPFDVAEVDIEVEPDVAVAAGLDQVEDWYATEFLRFWSKRSTDVGSWLVGRYALSGESRDWMTRCRQDIELQPPVGNLDGRDYRRDLDRAHAELAVYRYLVARMFLAAAPEEHGQVQPSWEHLGYAKHIAKKLKSFLIAADANSGDDKSPHEDGTRARRRQQMKPVGVDQAKLHVARALRDLLGEPNLKDKLSFVHELLVREDVKRVDR